MNQGSDGFPDLRERLSRQPWDEMLPVLMEFARKRVGVRFWGGSHSGRMPGGREAEDMVFEAIEKVWSGQRAWDPARDPDLVRHLKDVIESDVHHLAVGFENRRVVGETALGDRMVEGRPEPFLATVPAATPTPLEIIAAREAESEAKAFAAAFLASVEGDRVLRQVTECVFDGVTKPAEIAARIGRGAADVYNVRKRLQRRLMEFYADWGKKHEPKPRRW